MKVTINVFSSPQGNLVSLTDVAGPGASSRVRRSPGLVSLEDVAGPVAAHYPAAGPPAYVRPNYGYGYNNWYYNRPQPYYNRPQPYYNNYYYSPCIGEPLLHV